MRERASAIWKRLRRPSILFPSIAAGLTGGLAFGYLILLNPGSVFVRWAQARLPQRVTMITLGPYPEDADFQRLRHEGVKNMVSLLDPRLPYEEDLLGREQAQAARYGMIFKDFPMASILDEKIFPDYLENQQKAVAYLKTINAPAYVHCYLGKHRTLHVREALLKAGVPKSYFTAMGSSQDYWDFLNRLKAARERFDRDDFAGVLQILEPVQTKDVDVSSLRGWAHYRLGLIDDASKDFEEGLAEDPTNPRNLNGLGYCYLRSGQPVMAQRQFNRVLNQSPEDESALTGMGLAYLRLENRTQAVTTFRQVLVLDPDNPEVKGFLKRAQSP
jgi:tetratricopeptide (TPR) repeat protein